MKKLSILLSAFFISSSAFAISTNQAYSNRVPNTVEGIMLYKQKQTGLVPANDDRYNVTHRNNMSWVKEAVQALPCAAAGGWVGIASCIAGNVAFSYLTTKAIRAIDGTDITIQPSGNEQIIIQGGPAGSLLSSNPGPRCRPRNTSSLWHDCDWYSVMQEIGETGSYVYAGDTYYNLSVFTTASISQNSPFVCGISTLTGYAIATASMTEGHMCVAEYVVQSLPDSTLKSRVHVWNMRATTGAYIAPVPTNTSNAIAKIPDSVGNNSLSDDMIRELVDALWKYAYQYSVNSPSVANGTREAMSPYPNNAPVTNSDVVSYRNVNPNEWPSFNNAIAPITSPNSSEIFPNVPTNNNSNPASGSFTTIEGDGGVVDFEEPTISTDLVFDQLRQLKSHFIPQFNAPLSSACPTWTFNLSISGHDLHDARNSGGNTISEHCQFLDDNESQIRLIMYVFWSFSAFFLFMRS